MSRHHSRRRVLGATLTAVATGLAGCGVPGEEEDDEEDEENEGGEDEDEENDDRTAPDRGLAE